MNSPADIKVEIAPILARYGHDAGKLMGILWAAQDRCGWVSDEVIDAVAAGLGVPRTRVVAVANFYTFFREAPHGRYEILFSDNITDHLQGKPELMRYLCEKLWVEPGKLSEDGLVFVESTSCTGMCDQGPGMLVNGMAIPRLSRERIDVIAEQVRAQRPVGEWPAELFQVEDNVRRAGVLTGEAFAAGEALHAAVAVGAETVLAQLDCSNLRGRGGAGFKTATKWASCRRQPVTERYVVCNADEGEPGTFKDRVLLNSFAEQVFDGMTVCGYVIGARKGLLYLRGEYRYLLPKLEANLERRRAAGLLGRSILGQQGFDFDLEIVLGAGAYVCGEESALIESLEGKPGKPRNRPPYPDTCGYLGKPTVVNNVETFASAARIAVKGGEWFAAMGTAQSAGTKLLSVSGDCERPGIYEYPFGVSVAEVLRACGAREPKAVQVSGPSGTLISWKEFDRRIAFEDLPTAGAFMVFNRERDIFNVVRNFAHFFAHESCGFCTPCRVGTTLMKGCMDKIHAGRGTAHEMEEIRRLSHILLTMSHCGLGHTAANPVVQAMEKFPGTFERKLKHLSYEPGFDLDKALGTARLITGRDDMWAHILEDQ